MNKPDLNIVQTEEPFDRKCSSGHFPPETFVLDGNVIPMRFFIFTGHGISGIFCEQCLTMANQMAEEIKQRK